MTHSFPLRRWTAGEIAVEDAAVWAEALGRRLREGDRVVTAFGRNEGEGDSVLLTAIVQTPSGQLEALRGRADREKGYHSLTPEHPAMHCFEREIHEQTALPIAGHPWLKPVRFQGRAASASRDYPFYRIAGKEVHEVQVGPIHAGVIEPGAFRFMCVGELVHHLEIHLGFQHRGVESLLLRGEPRAQTQLVETIAGDTSIGHAWAYCAAIESLGDVALDPSVQAVRALGLELERVAMHLASLAGLAGDIGFLQGGSSYGRLRTTAINTSMRLCGSRFGRGWMRPGINRVAIDRALMDTVRANVGLLVRDLAVINERFVDSATVRHRFRGTGVVTSTQAREIGMVGMTARASGIALDQRSRELGAYKTALPEVCVEETGDVWARARVRIREIDGSLAWIAGALDTLTGIEASRSPVEDLAPGQLVVAICEGFRGEIVHTVETDGQGRFVHYKVQDPSLRNWFGLALALRENEISDFPICNKSFDLSYCGNDL